MKKKYFIVLLSMFFIIPYWSYAQEKGKNRDFFVMDPTLIGTIGAATASEVAVLNNIENKEEEIQNLQAGIAALQGQINSIEQKTMKYLSRANDVLNTITWVQGLVSDIRATKDYLVEGIEVIQEEPYLVLMTYNVMSDMVERTTQLLSYVTNIAFVWDQDANGNSTNGSTPGQPKNLLNNAERLEIFTHVSNEIQVIKGEAFYLKSMLKVAKKNSVFQNLCPREYQIVRNCQRTADRIIHDFSL